MLAESSYHHQIEWLRIRPAAVCGLSVETAQVLLTSGVLPPYPPEKAQLPYQQPLLANGGHLYYAIPFYHALKNQPELLARMQQAHPREANRFHLHLSTRNAIRHAMYYAHDNSLAFGFAALSGLPVDDSNYYLTLGLAQRLAPQAFMQYANDLNLGVESKYVRDEQIDEFIQNYPDHDRLVNALEMTLKRRGVLFYFTPAIFNYRVDPGYEDEHEVTIVTNEPLLRYRDIMAIEALTPDEQKLLRQYSQNSL